MTFEDLKRKYGSIFAIEIDADGKRKALPGLRFWEIVEDFGLVPINPSRWAEWSTVNFNDLRFVDVNPWEGVVFRGDTLICVHFLDPEYHRYIAKGAIS